MSFTLYSLVAILTFIIAAIIETYRGYKRGFVKSLISFATLLLSIILSLVLTPLITAAIARAVIKTLDLGLSSALADVAAALAGALVSALVFWLFAFIFKGIFAAVTSILYKKLLKTGAQSHEPSPIEGKKVLGALVGLLGAVVLTMTLTSPVMGTLDVLTQAADIAETGNDEIWEDLSIEKKDVNTVRTYSSDLVGGIFYRAGGKYIYYAAASGYIDGKKVYLLPELEEVGGAVEGFMEILPVIRGKQEAEKEHADIVYDLCERVEKMEFSTLIVYEYLPKNAEKWLEGKKNLGIKKPDVSPIVEPVFNEVIAVCARSTENNIKENTLSLLRTYGAILSSEIDKAEISDYVGLMTAIEDSEIIELLTEALSGNSSMKEPFESINSIAVRAYASEIGISKYGKSAYSKLIMRLGESFSDVKNKENTTDDEKAQLLSVYVKSALREYGIILSDAMSRYTARQMLYEVETQYEDEAIAEVAQFFDRHKNTEDIE